MKPEGKPQSTELRPTPRLALSLLRHSQAQDSGLTGLTDLLVLGVSLSSSFITSFSRFMAKPAALLCVACILHGAVCPSVLEIV